VTELAGLIVLHLLLGLGLAAAVWGAGLGALLGVDRGDAALRPERAVLAYPVGLLIVAAAAFAALLSPWLGAAALALVAAALVPLVRERRRLELLRPALAPLAWALPFVAGLPFALGLLLHGPTDEVPSSAYGDYVFWATRTVSAADSIVPFDDLLVVDRKATYVEGSSTFLGAALSDLPGFDVFLFQTTALPALMAASFALGLGLLLSGRERARNAALLATLAVATIAYPSWLPESPPVALAAPLTFVLYAIWSERLPLRALVGLAAVLVVDLYLTKGFVVLALAIVFGVALARDHRVEVRRVLTPLRIVAGVASAVVAIVLLWKLGLLRGPTATLPEPSFQFVPAEAARGLLDQLDGRDTQAAAPALGVVGALALAVALVRARAWTVLGVLVVGLLASWTVVGYGFDLVIGIAVLLSVLFFRSRPELIASVRWPLAVAAVALGLSTWFREISGYRAGFVLVLLLGAAFLAALLAVERDARAYAYSLAAVGAALLFGLSGRSFVGFAVGAALAAAPRLLGGRGLRAAAAGLAASAVVAAVATADDDFRISRQRVTLTTEHRDIWRRVLDVVPRDALVFTSMTGEIIDGDRGWNYYPGIAGRQLYIGGWYDGPLLVEPEERARRLRVNRAILAGRATPADEPLARSYDAHFAVMRTSERAPASFRLLYRNDRFALYRIGSRGT
jgi:hypothetical protein